MEFTQSDFVLEAESVSGGEGSRLWFLEVETVFRGRMFCRSHTVGVRDGIFQTWSLFVELESGS